MIRLKAINKSDIICLQTFLTSFVLSFNLQKRPDGSEEPTYNIMSVWEAGYKGKGILVGVVDDGVDGSHPDLSPNYVIYD